VIRAIGMLLRAARSSETASPLARPDFQAPATITVTSPAFVDGGAIPERYAGPGVGENVSPALQWTGMPPRAQQVVVLMDDIDVPLPRPLFHTIAILEPDQTSLGEGRFVTGSAGVRIIGTRLSRSGYSGPRPIPGHGPHRYRFHVLALDRRVPHGVSSARNLLDVVAGHVIARGTVVGTYER